MKTKTYTPRPLDTNDVELPQELEVLVEQNGYFFRQYSIVSNGTLIPIPPKGKSRRRALCLKDNVFMIIESVTSESYHDFAQALEDIGVCEALALVGGNSAVMWREESG